MIRNAKYKVRSIQLSKGIQLMWRGNWQKILRTSGISTEAAFRCCHQRGHCLAAEVPIIEYEGAWIVWSAVGFINQKDIHYRHAVQLFSMVSCWRSQPAVCRTKNAIEIKQSLLSYKIWLIIVLVQLCTFFKQFNKMIKISQKRTLFYYKCVKQLNSKLKNCK